MSQHDFDIANAASPASRTDINNALQALNSGNSGATAPATTFANQLWYDTANNILKMRNEADDAWIDLGVMNQTSDEFELDFVGVKASQAQAEAGTDNATIMTPLRTAQAITKFGAWDHLDRQVAAASAALNFTAFDATKFDHYKFIGANIFPVNNEVNLRAQVSINGGTGYITTGYSRAARGRRTDGLGAGTNFQVDLDGSAGMIARTQDNAGNAAGECGVSFELTLLGPHLAKATIAHLSHMVFLGNGGISYSDEWGTDNQTTAVNALRFLFSAGNISTGFIDMFGIRNS